MRDLEWRSWTQLAMALGADSGVGEVVETASAIVGDGVQRHDGGRDGVGV